MLIQLLVVDSLIIGSQESSLEKTRRCTVCSPGMGMLVLGPLLLISITHSIVETEPGRQTDHRMGAWGAGDLGTQQLLTSSCFAGPCFCCCLITDPGFGWGSWWVGEWEGDIPVSGRGPPRQTTPGSGEVAGILELGTVLSLSLFRTPPPQRGAR